jgi:uncharacterized protein YdaU (DUF1376 family)
MYYDSEKPLKPDIKVLSFQIGATPEDTELLLESFFILCASGWHQSRCDPEIADYREFVNKKNTPIRKGTDISGAAEQTVGTGYGNYVTVNNFRHIKHIIFSPICLTVYN